MDVVDQLGSESHFGSNVIEHRGDGFDVQVLVEGLARIASLRPVSFIGADEPAAAVPLSVLKPDVAKAVLHRLGHGVGSLLLRASRDVVVAGYGVVRSPAKHFVNGHAGTLALDVP